MIPVIKAFFIRYPIQSGLELISQHAHDLLIVGLSKHDEFLALFVLAMKHIILHEFNCMEPCSGDETKIVKKVDCLIKCELGKSHSLCFGSRVEFSIKRKIVEIN